MKKIHSTKIELILAGGDTKGVLQVGAVYLEVIGILGHNHGSMVYAGGGMRGRLPTKSAGGTTFL